MSTYFLLTALSYLPLLTTLLISPYSVSTSHFLLVTTTLLLFSSYAALPPPAVITTSSGIMSPGSSIILSCTVEVVEGLIVQPAIVWTKLAVDGDTALNSISVGAVRTNNTVTLSFNSINTSDAGQYTCTATVNISAINITVTNNSMVDITLQSE